MPKQKTHSGIKDRFRVTKTGKLMRRHSGGSHFLEKKSALRKRGYAGVEEQSGKVAKNMKQKLGA